MIGCPALGRPEGMRALRHELYVPSPTWPVGWMFICRWYPAIPESATLPPALPSANSLVNSAEKPLDCHGQRPAREMHRFAAMMSGPSSDFGFPAGLPFAYNGRGNGHVVTAGPPGYAFSHHSLMSKRCTDLTGRSEAQT